MRVVVTLRRALLRAGGCRAQSGRHHITLTVNGARIGDPDLELGEGDHVLGGEAWSHTFDDDGGRLAVRANVRDGDCWSDTVEQTWRPAYPREQVIVGSGWLLGLDVQSPLRQRDVSPSVRVARSSDAARHRTTAVAPPPRIRFEIDPVIPFPDRLASRRPAWTHEIAPTFERADLRAGGPGTSAIVNPAVIARTVDPEWTATISYTRIWAPGQSEAQLNARVRWQARSLDGGATVDFVGPDRGTSVRVRGAGADGEVAIDAMMGSRVLATHRALVRRPVALPIRFTDTEVPPTMTTVRGYVHPVVMATSTRLPGELTRSINTANRRLAALGLRLVPQPQAEVVGEFTRASGEAACFVRVAQCDDDVMPPEAWLGEMVRRSAAPHVLSFVITQMLPGGAAGIAALPCLAAGPVADSGTPSSSWDPPSGVPPSAAATRQEIQTVTAYMQAYLARLTGSTEHIYGGMLKRQAGGDTLAHEVGHVVGMKHRDPALDGRPERPENLMSIGGGLGDFDILQARVAWQSALVRHWHRASYGGDPP